MYALSRLVEAQIAARARMYMRSAREAYERAHNRAVGGPDLPAYPGDGSTVCLTNCQCSWRLVHVVDPDTGEGYWECYWELGIAEHCPDCLDRSDHWYPLVLPESGAPAPVDLETTEVAEGGPTSGHWGHKGVPGQHGGSAKGTGSWPGAASPRVDALKWGKWGGGTKESPKPPPEGYVYGKNGLLQRPAGWKAKQPVVLYHGTSAEYIDSVREHGLVAGKGKGADYCAEIDGWASITEARVGDRAISVYITKSRSVAEEYAAVVSKATGGKGVIFTIRMPKAEAKKLVKDELDRNGLRYEGTIPVDWIAGATVSEADDGAEIIYIVAVVDDERAA